MSISSADIAASLAERARIRQAQLKNWAAALAVPEAQRDAQQKAYVREANADAENMRILIATSSPEQKAKLQEQARQEAELLLYFKYVAGTSNARQDAIPLAVPSQSGGVSAADIVAAQQKSAADLAKAVALEKANAEIDKLPRIHAIYDAPKNQAEFDSSAFAGEDLQILNSVYTNPAYTPGAREEALRRMNEVGGYSAAITRINNMSVKPEFYGYTKSFHDARKGKDFGGIDIGGIVSIPVVGAVIQSAINSAESYGQMGQSVLDVASGKKSIAEGVDSFTMASSRSFTSLAGRTDEGAVRAVRNTTAAVAAVAVGAEYGSAILSTIGDTLSAVGAIASAGSAVASLVKGDNVPVPSGTPAPQRPVIAIPAPAPPKSNNTALLALGAAAVGVLTVAS